MEIPINNLKKWDININQYLSLYKLFLLNNKEKLDFNVYPEDLGNLIRKDFIAYGDNNNIILKSKAKKIFELPDIDFEEIFNIYPHKTPNGRKLRASAKLFNGKITEDYKKLEEKYLRKVKSTDLHEKIIDIIQLMLIYRKKQGDLNYLNLLEVFINNNMWERYFDLLENKEKLLEEQGENVERI